VGSETGFVGSLQHAVALDELDWIKFFILWHTLALGEKIDAEKAARVTNNLAPQLVLPV
jgi:hypothetical protein